MAAAREKRLILRDGDRPGGRLHRHLRSRKLASGPSTWRRISRRAGSRRKPLNALGLQPSVRRDRVGQLFHRWYQPQAGRYTKPDPIKQELGANNWLYEPNVYGYVSNNPLRLIDPLGLYGTNACSYYTKRCEECGGRYYCN